MTALPPWYNILESGAVDSMMEVHSIARVDELHLQAGGVARQQSVLPQTPDLDQPLQGPYWPTVSLLEPLEIRVLELKPGSGGDPIRCSLHHCSLDVPVQATLDPCHALLMPAKIDLVAYTALSYTWGPNIFDALIQLDGYAKPVTAALERALKHFRRPDVGLMLWIDQLCINQVDEGEKEKQIPLMGRIYAQSFNTLVWLGDATAGSSETVKLLKYIAMEMHLDVKPLDIPGDLARRSLPGPGDLAWTELRNFFLRPWFTRVWINQEVWIPKVIMAMCGNEVINWEMLVMAYDNLQSSGLSRWMFETLSPPEDELDRGVNVISRAGRLWVFPPAVKSMMTQTELMGHIRACRCYDPRDKVYGLLGMLKTPRWDKVSYAQTYTTAMLYRDVVAYRLEHSPRSLDQILASVDHDYTQTLPGLPSWVPDWSQPRQTSRLRDNFSGVYGNKNQHCFPSPPHEQDAKVDIRGVELHRRAVFVDRIAKTTGRLRDPSISLLDPQTRNKDFLVACADLAAAAVPGSPYPSDTVFEAFWRTLVADKDDSNRLRAPDSYAELFSFLLDQSTGRSPSFPGQTYSSRQRKPQGRGGLDLDMLAGTRTVGLAFRSLHAAAGRAAKNRRFAVTEKKRFGLVPHWAQEGDAIAIVQGCNIPFVLRVDGREYHVIGECYVHGIMSGEVVGSGEKAADIVLV
ncbi:hypothetical protein MAPG_08888 [Magnaporthiopsis poae ATCC 64411]|uniref:Heterokaryon incompatibility domain-containing protein n=1 Tax=Magnaporthiopsis poae (strain ATCC 64411 / 73-15) TaxID=644358 RepID=A0A0C4E8I0_MAGP6|nr:hypothetical protein MAPG_08888 [Magnaporthiopsis poae ATCC 64411]